MSRERRDPTLALDQDSLGLLGDRVAVPGYDRDGVTPGIVHLGVGGFHRAHEAFYVDRLLRQGLADEWGICGVGLLPQDSRMRDVMAAQDRLYTLVQRHPDGTVEAQVIGSIVDYLFAPDDPDRVVERMASPGVRIVSMTVTEGGYNLRSDGEFDGDDPAVRRDLEPGAAPTTVFAFVTEALARRRERGIDPFTVVSCDNLEENGEKARNAFTSYARLKDPALAGWMADRVAFPSSMVDRITPATTDADRALLADSLGVQDAWPVVCEPYHQWVIQDDFTAGRPPWEEAGVQLVPDVRPYELMKLRLLNASHQVMGYLGSLAGYGYVHDVCRDPDFVALLRGYMEREATPTLDPVPGVDLGDYRSSLLERFTNEAIGDTLARQCVDSTERIPKFLLPVVRQRLQDGGEIDRAALAIAGWARHAEGVDDAGRPLEVVDVRRDQVLALARQQQDDPTAMLGLSMFDGLREDRRFVTTYVAALRTLHEHGARAAVARYAGTSAD